MHFNSAVVLSTLAAAGTVTASNLHHGHSNFHAKRDVEAKRQYENVNWAEALKDVNWATVKFGNGASAPAAAPSAPAPEVNVASAPKTTAAAEKPATSAAAKPSSTPAAATPSKAPSSGGAASDLLDISAFSKLGVKAGLNAKTKGNGLWLGNDSKYKATFTNDGDKNAAVICWTAAGMWINVQQPQIFVNLKAGESTTVSIPEGFSGGCGAALPDSNLFMGLLNESILEFTAFPREKGCFDISREINMKGVVLSSKGSQCTSGVAGGKLSCVFVCNAGNSCEKAGSYAIALGSASKGPCMVGTASDGGASGGCQFGDGEHMQVTIAGHRDWPSS
ncbi:hypothetical protein CC80DRAFT_138403 [Byssothecium circinans]|uniref:Uncharacterized protein n=1 Tax=Byssothecium circinans TaxID=147558 RepID=A0A6A5TXS8_9PLEO|nr:hypothetical protein CC80DRAFT_138403 [Byssothecium circinans]